MSIEIIHHDPPETKRPKFLVDVPLKTNMPDSYTLLQNMNRSFSCGFLVQLGLENKSAFVHPVQSQDIQESVRLY